MPYLLIRIRSLRAKANTSCIPLYSISGITEILREPHVWVFLSMILVIGYFNGILMTFAYLYLRLEMGASQLCLGACVVTTVVVEVPILFVGGKIVDKVINIYSLLARNMNAFS